MFRFRYARGVVAAGVLCWPHEAAAMEHEFQIWNSGTEQVRIVEKVELWLDEHARRRNESTLFIVRPALGYRLLESLTLHAGYAWVPVLHDSGELVNEHRVWQQALWSLPRLGVALPMLRPRLEQRFSPDGDDVGHRARLFARVNIVPDAAPAVMLALWDEVFYQLNDTDWGPTAGFDQNRFFVGPGFPTELGVRFEVGYLNVYQRAVPNRMAHVLAVNAFLLL